jgi:acyl carrier protein
MDLDFFVLFSSTTSLWGARELAHYAAANVFLDGFAHYRQAHGLPALTINWGLWEVMHETSAEEKQRGLQFGLKEMPSEQALATLGDLLGSTGIQQVTVAAVDWHVLKTAYEARRPRPFLERVNNQKPAQEKRPSEKEPEILQRWLRAEPDERRDLLLAYIRAEVGKVFRMDPSHPIDVQQGLFGLGMDSLMSMELRSRLETSLGQPLPATLVFNYPTISDLAQYLETSVLASKTAVPLAYDAKPAAAVQKRKDGRTALSREADDLSEDQLAALLVKRLEQLK